MSTSSSTTSSIWHELISTFLASVRSVGTACTLAFVGIYLHQRGFVIGQGKRTLALISQQVTIPLLFFTKILYCNQDWSTDPCPNITESLKDVWILLIWPIYVCFMGIAVGYVCAVVAKVPRHQINGILAAVGFGNSTGLPITLLTVIHSNFPSDTNMGRIDPTLFLSVYLLLYPVLQWGIGGFLLAPPEKNKKKKSERDGIQKSSSQLIPRVDSIPNPSEQPLVRAIRKSSQRAVSETTQVFEQTSHVLAHNVINRSHRMPQKYLIQHRGLETMDASLYMSVQENLNRWGYPQNYPGSGNTSPISVDSDIENDNDCNDQQQQQQHDIESGIPHSESQASIGMDLSYEDNQVGNGYLYNSTDTNNSNVNALSLIQEHTSLRSTESTSQQKAHDIVPHLSCSGLSSASNETNNHETLFEAMKQDATQPDEAASETSALIPKSHNETNNNNNNNNNDKRSSRSFSSSAISPPSSNNDDYDDDYSDEEEEEHLCITIYNVVKRCFQPPVIGALLGILVASIEPLRGVFVDIIDRTGDAPLEWFFDGLYATGQAAVPINMMILGCNLSASYMLDANDDNHRRKFFTKQAGIAVVVGKMIVLPIIGFISTYLLQFIYPVPDDIAGSFYLVLLIVFLCPTANNVMVMVELSGNGSKEGMARIIAYQYMVAPIILSLTVTGSVMMASSM